MGTQNQKGGITESQKRQGRDQGGALRDRVSRPPPSDQLEAGRRPPAFTFLLVGRTAVESAGGQPPHVRDGGSVRRLETSRFDVSSQGRVRFAEQEQHHPQVVLEHRGVRREGETSEERRPSLMQPAQMGEREALRVVQGGVAGIEGQPFGRDREGFGRPVALEDHPSEVPPGAGRPRSQRDTHARRSLGVVKSAEAGRDHDRDGDRPLIMGLESQRLLQFDLRKRPLPQVHQACGKDQVRLGRCRIESQGFASLGRRQRIAADRHEGKRCLDAGRGVWRSFLHHVR